MTSAYSRSGVRTTEELRGFPEMLRALRPTLRYRDGLSGAPALGFGHYANVLDIGGVGVAITTDGVGSKVLIAKAMQKYDTIGIDCVAMNVNDLICVGAEPIAMTDYIAIDDTDIPLEEIARGLAEGARQARITIPGGEIAQIREIVNGLDLVGTAIGVVQLDSVLTGATVESGNAIIGYASSGVHSNGLTLARRALLGGEKAQLATYSPDLGTTVGEELLRPTTIYVDVALKLISACDVRAFAHITSDGFLNLARLEAPVGHDIEFLPPTPPVFEMIRHSGGIPVEEMYLIFNMGIGFCAIVPEAEADAAIRVGRECSIDAWRIGTCTDDPSKTVRVRPAGLRSEGGHFVSVSA